MTDGLLAVAGLTRDPDGRLAMAGVPLSVIAADVGTPAFVYDAEGIRERYRALDRAMEGVPHRICFAVKANSNLAVLRLLATMGAGADIVSGGELLRVLAAGFTPGDIVFSGVGKTDDELVAALAAGVGHINVESVAELRRLAMIADLRGASVRVGIRVNPDVTVDTHPYISTGKGGLKFGVPTDQLDEALAIIDENPALTLDTLAMHLGSQLLDVEPYVAGVARLLGLLERVRAAGHSPAVLDIGGGIGIRYHDEKPLAPADWFGAIRDALGASGCTIHVEPGRYLVGNAGVMLTRVVHRKHSGGHDIAIVDAGMNDLLRPSLYKAWHEIVPAEPVEGEATPTDIVGPVCETGDFLALERDLPPVPAGGLLAVLGAGAYAFAMSSNYNSRARAAEVLVEAGRWAVVRPRERLTDLFASEVPDPFGSPA
ncbi:MAG: diaminopimelate decarboxylase [Gemmatimonadales bacterium]